MEIIKKGMDPTNRKYQADCRYCETVFTFIRGEGKITYDQRDGDYVVVNCPVCKTSIRKDIKDYIKPEG